MTLIVPIFNEEANIVRVWAGITGHHRISKHSTGAPYIFQVFPAVAITPGLDWEKIFQVVQKSCTRLQPVSKILVVLALIGTPLFDAGFVLNYKFFVILISMVGVLVTCCLIRVLGAHRALWSGVVVMGGIMVAIFESVKNGRLASVLLRWDLVLENGIDLLYSQ